MTQPMFPPQGTPLPPPPAPPPPAPALQYPVTPTATQLVLMNLGACAEAVIAFAANTSVQDVWNTTTGGDWLMWWLVRQAPNSAERQRIAGCLATMMNAWVTTANLPTPASYAAASGVLANLQSFAAGSMSGFALVQSALPLEAIKPVAQTTAGLIEFQLVQAVADLARACANSDPVVGSQWVMKSSTCIRQAMQGLVLAPDFPSTRAILATAVRAAVPFKDYTTSPPTSP